MLEEARGKGELPVDREALSVLKVERIYEAASLRSLQAFSDKSFDRELKVMTGVVNKCALAISGPDSSPHALTALTGISRSLWGDIRFAEAEARKAGLAGDDAQAARFRHWEKQCRYLAAYAEEVLSEFAEPDWSLRVAEELGQDDGRRFITAVGLPGIERRLWKDLGSDANKGMLGRLFAILAPPKDALYYGALTRLNQLGCAWIWRDESLSSILDPILNSAIAEEGSFTLCSAGKEAEWANERCAEARLRFLKSTGRADNLIEAKLAEGSTRAAVCVMEDGANLNQTQQAIVLATLKECCRETAIPGSERRRLVQSVFPLRSDRNVQKIQNIFLDSAADDEIEGWLRAMQRTEVGLYETFGLKGVSALSRKGVSANAIRKFVRTSCSYYDGCFIIPEMVNKFDGRTIEHLINLYDGNTALLRRTMRLYDPNAVYSQLSLAELMASDNIAELAEKGADRLVGWAIPLIDAAGREMLRILDEDRRTHFRTLLSHEYFETTVAHFRSSFPITVRRLQRSGLGVSARVLAGILSDREILRSFSGRDDADVLVPPTWPSRCRITDVKSVLNTIFGGEIWTSDVNRPDPSLKNSRYRTVSRGTLRKELVLAAFRFSEVLQARVKRGGRELHESILEALQKDERARVAFEETLEDEVFIERAIAPALRRENVPVKYVTLRLAPKSDFQSITALDQLGTCARLGMKNSRGFQIRLDNSLFLVEGGPGGLDDAGEILPVAAGPMWRGEDIDTFILNNGHIAANWRAETSAINSAMRAYATLYCLGKLEYYLPFMQPQLAQRVHAGNKTGEIPGTGFPLSGLEYPVGDPRFPGTKGKYPPGWNDCDCSQVLWVNAQEQDADIREYIRRLGF